jgi:coiled-coil and C2 domain-containing protein 1
MLTGDENTMEKAEMIEIPEEEQEESNDPESKEENDSMQKLVKLLQERLTVYEMAEQKAKRENESGRARRFNRGVRTLKEMLTSAQSGRGIDEADIPPPLPSSATVESTEKDTSKIYFFLYVLLYISI